MKCIQTQNGKKLVEAPAYIYVVALPVLGGLTWKLVFLNKKPTCVSVSLWVCVSHKIWSLYPLSPNVWGVGYFSNTLIIPQSLPPVILSMLPPPPTLIPLLFCSRIWLSLGFHVGFLKSRQPSIGFSNSFFSWKLRSICKFWIQNDFCATFGGWYICNTKWDSWLDDSDQNSNYLI